MRLQTASMPLFYHHPPLFLQRLRLGLAALNLGVHARMRVAYRQQLNGVQHVPHGQAVQGVVQGRNFAQHDGLDFVAQAAMPGSGRALAASSSE